MAGKLNKEQFQENLNRLLSYPEVRAYLDHCEADVVDNLGVETNQENILELVRMLKVIRSFKAGMSKAEQLGGLKESGFRSVAPEEKSPAPRKRGARTRS